MQGFCCFDMGDIWLSAEKELIAVLAYRPIS